MAQPIATVVALTGQAFARDEQGQLRELQPGSVLMAGEILVTSQGSRVELSYTDGGTFTQSGEQAVMVTSELSSNGYPDLTDSLLADNTADQILQALNEGKSLDEILQAPAAGPGASENPGSSFVSLTRLNETIQGFEANVSLVPGSEFPTFVPPESEATELAVAAVTSIPTPTPPTEPPVTPPPPPPPPSDTTAPVASVTSILTADNTPALSGTVDDPTATVVVTIDGHDYTATNNGDGTWTLADNVVATLPDGVNDVTVTATDPAGNAGTGAGTVTVDTTPPVVTVTSIVTADNTPALSGTVDDPTATVVVTVDGHDYTATNNGDGTWTLADNVVATLPDGVNGVTVTATDPLANAGTGTGTATVDTTPPVVTVTSIVTADNTPALSGTVDDPTATVVVTVEGHDYTATNNGDGTWTLADDVVAELNDGVTPVDVRATDPLNNAGSNSGTITIDTQGPEVSFTDLVTNDATPELHGTVDDPTATVVVTINGQDYTATNNGDGSWTLADDVVATLSPGVTPATVTATDTLGNQGGDNGIVTLQVNQPPVAVGEPIVGGLHGEYFAYHEGGALPDLSNVAQLEAWMKDHHSDVTFTSTNVNYNRITGDLGADGKLQQFLGADAASLSADPPNSSDAMIRLSGFVKFDAGTYNFKVYGDDGFSIRIDGQVVGQYDANQPPTTRELPRFTISESGYHEIEILYWDHYGEAALKVEWRMNNGEYHVLGDTRVSHGLGVYEDSSLTVDPGYLLANDADPDGDALSILSVDNAQHGTVTLDSEGRPVFQAEHGYTGLASFDYTISDGHGGTSTATAEMMVVQRPNGSGISVVGSAENDVLAGTSGSDSFLGGLGSDTFKWTLADKGTAGSAQTDTVKDFSADPYASGGDRLDLRDLLTGESHHGLETGNLTNFLHFEKTGADTTVHVSSTGGFSTGFNAAAVDQTIVLQGVDLVTGHAADQQIISDLLSKGKLVTD